MTGTETQILRIVANRGPVETASVAREMGVSAGYVTPRMRSLAKSGYLQGTPKGGYTITGKAAKAVSPYAGRNSGAVPVSRFP